VKIWLLALALAVALVPLAVMADDDLVEFNGGIGVDPEVGANVVRGVAPGGQPWEIASLRADVETDGHIVVVGRGVLLAGGDGIATNGGQSVRAELFCGPASSATKSIAPTAGVALDSNGNFRIKDVLLPAPPNPCTSPVLLIVSAANGHWFAAGIPGGFDEHHHHHGDD
jgi:hypothetical protein